MIMWCTWDTQFLTLLSLILRHRSLRRLGLADTIALFNLAVTKAIVEVTHFVILMKSPRWSLSRKTSFTESSLFSRSHVLSKVLHANAKSWSRKRRRRTLKNIRLPFKDYVFYWRCWTWHDFLISSFRTVYSSFYFLSLNIWVTEGFFVSQL